MKGRHFHEKEKIIIFPALFYRDYPFFLLGDAALNYSSIQRLHRFFIS